MLTIKYPQILNRQSQERIKYAQCSSLKNKGKLYDLATLLPLLLVRNIIPRSKYISILSQERSEKIETCPKSEGYAKNLKEDGELKKKGLKWKLLTLDKLL